MVASTEDRLDIFTAWVETVSLKIGEEVWHADAVVSFSNGVEDAHFNEVLAGGELPLRLVSSTVQTHLFVQEAGEEGEHLVGDGRGGTEVGRETARGGHMTQVRVRRGEDKLRKLVEV